MKIMDKDPSFDATGGLSRSGRKTIFLVDDHPMMRSGLADLINRQTDLTVYGEAGSPAEAIGRLHNPLPDLLVADLTMEGRSGIDFIKDLLVLHPSLCILVYTMHEEKLYGCRVLRAGAVAYVTKEKGGAQLLSTIRHVLRGEIVVSPNTAERVVEIAARHYGSPAKSMGKPLTDREFEVLRLVSEGKNAYAIATQLSISRKTVDVHRGHIREKLGLGDMTALVHYAARWTGASHPGP